MTPKTTTELQTSFADNSVNAIAPSDVRDFVVSVINKQDLTGTPSNSTFLRGDMSWHAGAGGGASDWGNIGGTIQDQTDLVNYVGAAQTAAQSYADTAAFAADAAAEAYTDTVAATLVPQTTTVAGHALSTNVTIAASDLTNGVTGSGTIALAASPALTGTPTVPTAAANTNTTQAASTAFVTTAVATSLPLAGGTMSGNINLGAHNLVNVGAINAGGGTLVISSGGNLDTSGTLAAATLTANNLTASRPVVSDSSKKLISIVTPTQSAYLTGTAYSLTNTSTAITGGTTSPTLTITNSGTYRIEFCLVLNFTGATIATDKNVTLKIRRTNNTAADLTNGTMPALHTGITTTYTATWGSFVWVADDYTATAGDIVTVFGDVATVPSAGSLDVTGGFLRATRIY